MGEDTVWQFYEDGRLAKEIEHLLVTRLHNLNTIQEVEFLKCRIYDLMFKMYEQGASREEEDA